MSKKQIFTEDEPQFNNQLRINKQFAERFEKTKQRQLLDQKRNQNIISDESSSQYSSEDSEGELITEQVSEKFLTTLAKIHAHDPSLNQGEVFDDSDFEQANEKPKESKPITYKDMVRESILKSGKEPGEEDEEESEIIVPLKEEENVKNAFISAARGVKQDDGFLKIKQKEKSLKNQEEQEYQQFINKKKKGKEGQLLQQFWTEQEKLDENDKFLRKFILSKGWIDKGEEEEEKQERKLLSEEEEFEEKNDLYEVKWNFRYEEPGSKQLLTYERKHDGPLHEKQSSKRKTARERQKQQKLQQKEQAKKEIEIIKQAKQSEIKQRLQKLETVAGGIEIEEQNLEEILREDYDPEKFDKAMKEMFSETGYYQEQEKNLKELKGYMKKARGDEEINPTPTQNKEKKENIISEDKDNADQAKTALPVGVKKKLKPEEIKQLQKEEFRIWYYCDNCFKGIQEFEMKFDCLECDDYSLCKKCKELFPHDHKMRKNFVPKGCQPPEDEEILKILQEVKSCKKCEQKISDYENYYKQKEDEIVYCEKCYNKLKFEKRNVLEMVKGKVDPNEIHEDNLDKLPKLVNDQKINELVDEYYALDFEDIIADGLKTKYKYVKVKAEDYGLTDDAIQYCDDKMLNAFVSVKKIAPYRQDEGYVQEKVLKKKRTYIEKNAFQNQKKLKKNLKQLSKIKDQLKQLKKQQKKSKKQKINQEIFELEKKEILLENIIQSGKDQTEKIEIQNTKFEEINQQPVQQKISQNISSTRLQSYGIGQ